MTSGEQRAWEILEGLDPENVSRRASVRYEGGNYVLQSLGMDFLISLEERTIKGLGPDAEEVIGKFGYFLVHSVLWYLVGAKDIGLTGRLVRPSDVRGGHHFFRGTHELPLDRVAEKYTAGKEVFIRRGKKLGGGLLALGDASLELLPLPRVPVTLVLWLGDEEFPPGVDLFFDSTCQMHLPLDIIWSVAMLCTVVML